MNADHADGPRTDLAAGGDDADRLHLGVLARCCAETYREMAYYFHHQMEMALPDADGRARGRREEEDEEAYLDLLEGRPPDKMTWWDYTKLMEHRPEVGARKWGALLEEAYAELESGSRASYAMSLTGFDTPRERAEFLALRTAFALQWQPAGGIEWALLDQMAQAYTMGAIWQRLCTDRVLRECMTMKKEEEEGIRRGWERPRLDYVQAQAQATDMVDRWQKVFLRTVRALRDLRRYSPAISVNVADGGQVNIGQQQVIARESRGGGG